LNPLKNYGRLVEIIKFASLKVIIYNIAVDYYNKQVLYLFILIYFIVIHRKTHREREREREKEKELKPMMRDYEIKNHILL